MTLCHDRILREVYISERRLSKMFNESPQKIQPLNNKSGKNDKVTDVCQNLMQTLSVYDNGSENVSIYNDHYQKPTPKMNRFVLRGFFLPL